MSYRSFPSTFNSFAGFSGPLDLGAPEDRFAIKREVEDRYRKGIRSPAIDSAIEDFVDALGKDDETTASRTAEELVRTTRAFFQVQGVPIYAHPVLPPQLTQRLRDVFREMSPDVRDREMSRIGALFEPSARPGAVQELAQFSTSATRGGAGGSPQKWKDELHHAPTWTPKSTALEDIGEYLFGGSPSVRPNAGPNERSWDQEFRERAQLGGRLRQQYEQREAWTSLGGAIRLPRETLVRDEIAKLQKAGYQPIFLSGKAPHPDDPYADRVSWPVQPETGKTTVEVVSPFDLRVKGGRVEFHPGVDFRNREPNGPVFSPRNGTILSIEENAAGGNQIFILNDDGSITGFSHTGALKGLQPGDEVYAGQQVGVSDGSGTWNPRTKAFEPHTHISLYPAGTPIDPRTMKPIQGADAHDPNAPARTQSDPMRGLEFLRPTKTQGGRTPVTFLPRTPLPK